MYLEKTRNGIEYSEELAGDAGMAFMLFPTAEHTPDMINAAKAELRTERDVVYIGVASEKNWDERYRSKILRPPFVSHLRWFEIRADISFINEHRRAGTSVIDYINTYVLPFTADTKAFYVAKYGTEILDR